MDEEPASTPDQSPEVISINCAMNGGTGSAPSDVHGAATPTNIIEVTNSDIMIKNKSNCALVSSMSLKTFFGGFAIPAAESLFDPRVVYDRLAGRCIVTVELRNSGNTDQFLYVASSRTSSCTTWRRIRFVLSRASTGSLFCKASAANFYDFPNLGYNNTRAVVTSNNFTSRTGSFLQATLLSIDKVALHGTAPVFARCFRGGSLPFSMAPAIQGDFGSSMFILSTGAGSGFTIRRLRLTSSGSGSGIADTLTSLSSILIPFWTAPPDAPQPNLQKLDTLDGRFQSASKQIFGSLWNVHTVNSSGRAVVRLYKVSTSGSLLFRRNRWQQLKPAAPAPTACSIPRSIPTRRRRARLHSSRLRGPARPEVRSAGQPTWSSEAQTHQARAGCSIRLGPHPTSSGFSAGAQAPDPATRPGPASEGHAAGATTPRPRSIHRLRRTRGVSISWSGPVRSAARSPSSTGTRVPGATRR